MASDQSSERWKEVAKLLRRIEPQMIETFSRYRVDPEAAAEILDEMVILLLYRWGEVVQPEAWLLEILEQKSWRHRSEPPPAS